MIVKAIQRLMSGGLYYVRIRSELVSIRDVSAQKTIEDAPLIALTTGDDPMIVAIGQPAPTAASVSKENCVVVNPFDHPRTIISKFVLAEKLLQYLFRQLIGEQIFRASPIVVVHPLEKIEGGLTQVEARALRELGQGIGARRSFVYTGPDLSDTELKKKQFRDEYLD